MEECNTDNGSEAQARDCIGELLSGSTVDAKEAEFRKEAEARLSSLAGSVAAEEGDYRTKHWEGLLERWWALNEKIADLKKHFKCYNVECFIQKVKPLR